MSIKTIHGVEIDVQNDDNHQSIKDQVHDWEYSESSLKNDIEALKDKSGEKMYLGHNVFEKRGGKYILRHSSQF
jgi:hypothetical protein